MTGLTPKETTGIYQTAFLVSIACVLQTAESFIPHPIPGLRIGLANISTMIALLTLGFGAALEVSILRAILSSFILGSFMSPGFILSFSAAVMSTLAMGLLYWLSRFHPRYRFGIVGISVAGALVHNMVQLYLAYFLLIRHVALFVFLPWLALGAVVTGWITAAIAGNACRRIKESRAENGGGLPPRIDYVQPLKDHYLPGNSLLHRLGAQTKIIALVSLSVSVLIFNSAWFFAGLFLAIAVLSLSMPAVLLHLFSRIKGYLSLVIIAFFLPVAFSRGADVLFQWHFIVITGEGVRAGLLFAGRNILLILLSTLVIVTTPTDEMMRSLARLLSFLKVFGISSRRISCILSMSWVAIGALYETVREALREAKLREVNGLKKLVPLLSATIASLYVDAGRRVPEGSGPSDRVFLRSAPLNGGVSPRP